jgi:hypothetical protein
MNSLSRVCIRLDRPLLLASIFAAMGILVPPSLAKRPADDARTIMQRVYDQDTSRDASLRANFQIFDKNHHASKKDFLYRRLGPAGHRKILVVFSDPQDIRGLALLSIAQPGAAPEQYLYTPALHREREVAQQDRSSRFIGTDFTFEDISEHALDDFSYKMIADSETMENHKVYKLEGTPFGADRSQYKFVYYWIAQDLPLILHEEMYDSQAQEIRTLHASDLKRVDGIWGARRLEMATVAEGTRTVLTIDEAKFNTGLDEKLFTPEALENLP